MRAIRTVVPGCRLKAGACIDLPGEEAHHLTGVLRLGDGDTVHVMDGAGGEARATLRSPGKKRWQAQVAEVVRQQAEPPGRRLVLAPALTKGDALEEAWQRAVELGALGLWPIQARRSAVQLDEARGAKRRQRFERVAAEALKQCERLWMPTVEAPMGLAECLTRARGEGLQPIWLRERTAEAPALAEAAGRLDRRQGIVVLVGPEGGWAPEECDALEALAVPAASLGSVVLRAETALLAAAVLLASENP